MRAAFRVYLALAYYFAVSVILIASFTINLLCWMVGLIPGSGRFSGVFRTLLQLLFRFWAWFMGTLGLLNLETPSRLARGCDRGQIWVMNHPSRLDGMYTFKFLSNGTCIYKRDIRKNPFFGAIARLAGYIPNIGGPDMIRMACEALEKGENLIIFPEGTRSTHLALDAFKPGFALIAKRSKSPIRVMWIESPNDFMTREVPIWRVPRLPAHVTLGEIGCIDPRAIGSTNDIVEAVKHTFLQYGQNERIRKGAGSLFPEGFSVRRYEDSLSLGFRIPSTYPYFEGHFPGNPLVPAFIQVRWAIKALELFLGRDVHAHQLSRFKFLRPVTPNAEICATVKQEAETFTFMLFSNGELSCKGMINLTEPDD